MKITKKNLTKLGFQTTSDGNHSLLFGEEILLITEEADKSFLLTIKSEDDVEMALLTQYPIQSYREILWIISCYYFQKGKTTKMKEFRQTLGINNE